MAEIIYSGTYTTGITLFDPATQLPATITLTGYITNTTAANYGDAVFGTNAAAWTIANYGTIKATGTSASGVRLAAGSTITNASTSSVIAGYRMGIEIAGRSTINNLGTIACTGTSYAGIWLNGGGEVNNSGTSALIAGADWGIVVQFGVSSDNKGTVTNAGTIQGTAVSSSGVLLGEGGTVTNESSGLIEGGARGVVINTSTASVVNLGTIAAGNGSPDGSTAVWLTGGGVVTNGQSGSTGGLITAAEEGVIIGTTAGGVGTVTNYGTILGPDVGVELFAGGSVTNAGLIDSTSGTGVLLQAGGSVVNHFGGTISADYAGVFSSDAAGTVDNAGSIDSYLFGIYLYQGGEVLNQSTGIISAYGFGISVKNAAGTVTNAGSVYTTGLGAGIYLEEGGTVTNQASGEIVGTFAGVVVYQGVATIANAGTIYGYGYGVALGGGGRIKNESGGRISSEYFSGIYLADGATTIVNSGTIEAPVGIFVGIGNLYGNWVENSGAIIGTDGTAIAFHEGDDRLIVHAGASFTGLVDACDGNDRVDFTAAGTVDVTDFQGFETIVLASAGANSLSLADANFVEVTNSQITVFGGASGNTIDGSALSSGNRLVFYGGAGTDSVTGGAGNDVFVSSSGGLSNADLFEGGGGRDVLQMYTAGTINAAGVSGVESFSLASGGVNLLTLTNTNFTGVTGASITVYGGDDGNTVDASALTGANRLVYVLGAGTDSATGGAGNDVFWSDAADLSNADALTGGAGSDQLKVTTAGAVDIGGVSGVETIVLANGGTLTLTNANFTGVLGTRITVYGGVGVNTIDGSALSGTNHIVFVGSAGVDNTTGGTGNDVFWFAAADLSSADTLVGGGGSDTLQLTSAGTIAASGVSGVETFVLASGGTNLLTLTDANFVNVTGGRIYVYGGSGGNTVNASALTAANGIVFTGGAAVENVTGGAGGDVFKFSVANLSSADALAGGGGFDTLQMTGTGLVDIGGVSGVESFTLANGGINTLTLTNANFTGVLNGLVYVSGGLGFNFVDASALTGTNRIVFTSAGGLDTVTGGAGNDSFRFTATSLAITDSVAGGAGFDTLQMTTAGAVTVGSVSGVEIIVLASGGANLLTLTDANFTSILDTRITVYGGTGANTVNASTLTGANRILFSGAAGVDNATGGAGNDVFQFAAADLSSGDTLAGGGGADLLQLTTGGTISVGGVSGVETFALANGSANTLALADTNFVNVTDGRIAIYGGTAGNTVDGSALTGASHLRFIGIAGDDTVFAGATTTMTGGGGANRFTFDDIGTNRITDFAASASNALVLRDAGFDLGANEGQGTAALQHLDAGAFVANATGTFTNASQRFAYNMTNGTLSYDRDGSGGTFAASAVVVLTGAPSLAAGAAGQVYFTS